ncbi:hypothetical protein AVEN_157566-1 [Araneus ventricosus]|uniref:Uncharacterized protein n=1 Tax=Araneus ventricosus TaxID=182803 RepID=A0A4Y2HIX7_ARAVE|nr:hypothetical protein AVEN_157566-1 [Araneus ventricosus]
MNYTFKTAEEARKVLGIEGTDPSEVFSLTFFVPLCSLLVWLAASIIPISDKCSWLDNDVPISFLFTTHFQKNGQFALLHLGACSCEPATRYSLMPRDHHYHLV